MQNFFVSHLKINNGRVLIDCRIFEQQCAKSFLRGQQNTAFFKYAIIVVKNNFYTWTDFIIQIHVKSNKLNCKWFPCSPSSALMAPLCRKKEDRKKKDISVKRKKRRKRKK